MKCDLTNLSTGACGKKKQLNTEKNDKRKSAKGSGGVQISPANLKLRVRPQILLQLFYLLGGGGDGSSLASCQWKSNPSPSICSLQSAGFLLAATAQAIDDSLAASINNSASNLHSSRAADQQSGGGALVEIVSIH